MKERRTCRCGRVFWAREPKQKKGDVIKYVLCQRCRNDLSRQRELMKKTRVDLRDDLKGDVTALTWLERNRPDLVKRLRSKEPLNSRKGLNKDRVSG